MSRHVGLVGCGRWGRHILRDLKSLGCEVSVVARSLATRQRAADGGADRLVPRIPDLADLHGIDGVVVATTTSTHAATIEALLPLGVPMFVEKPLCLDPVRARTLVERAGERLFVMDKWRYHPGVCQLAELARSGALGRVLGVRSYRLGWHDTHDDIDSITILAPHDLAIGLEILGELPTPRAAVAQWWGGWPRGMVGLLGEDPWLAIEVSSTQSSRVRCVRLECEAGTAVLSDSYDDHVEIYRSTAATPAGEPLRGGETERRAISLELPLLLELRAFVEHLGGGPPPRSSAEEGLFVVEALSELRRLARAPSPVADVP